MFTRFVLRAIARWNRTLLVAATALLAIGAGQVAIPVATLRAWLWLVGGMILLYVSDVGREVETTAKALSTMSHAPEAEIRTDLFDARSSRWIAVLTLMAIGLVVVGVIRPQ